MTRAAPRGDLPASIQQPLARFGRRWFLVRLLRVAVVALAVHGLLVLVAAHVDRILFLDPPARLALTAAAIGIPILLLVAMAAVLWARRPGRRQLAYLFEKASGIDLAEAVVTAEALATAGDASAAPGATEGAASGVRKELLAELVASAEGMARRAAPRAAARDRWLRPAVLAALAVAAVGGLLAVWPAYQFPLMLARVYQPWRDLPKPSFMRIRVIPDAIEIGRGDELVVQAEVEGEPPWIVERLLKLTGVDVRRCLIEMDGEAPAEMTRVHRRLYLATRGGVTAPTGFRVRCGDARTSRHPVDVVVQPEVRSLSIAITPPAYTGRAAGEASAGPLAVLVGTKLAVTFQADQDVREAVVLKADRTPLPGVEWEAAGRTGRFAVEVDESQELTIDLVNPRGFRSVRPTVLAIEAVVDQTPVVRLDSPAAESEQVPAALVPLRAEVEDDLAIESAAIVWQLNPQLDPDAPLEEIPVPVAERGLQRMSIDLPLDLDATAAVPGDEVVAFLRVRDSAGNDGESSPFTIRVVSFTRGENERQRLAAVRWLAAALPAVQEAGEGAVGDDVRAALADDAKRLGVASAAEPSRAGLLALLEREAYATESSRSKQDAIALHGLLAAGRPVAAEAVTSLAARRRLENLAVRLFGMRGEAARIRAAVAAERKADGPPAGDRKPAAKPAGGKGDAADPLQRRTTLALRTLEDIGSDLLDLVRGVPAAGLDAAAITEAQARLNEAGYRMTRGSARKRIDACDRLTAEIDGLIAAIAPAAEPLRRLEEGARVAVSADLAATAGDLGSADDPRAREWFRRRLHALELDPFTPGADTLDALAHAVAPGGPAVTDAAEAERAWWGWLAAESDRRSLAALDGLADDERAMLAGWLAARLPAKPPGTFAAAVAAVGAAAPPLPVLAEPRQVAGAIVASVDRTVAAAATLDPVARAAAVAEWERGVDLAIMGMATRGRVVRLAAEDGAKADVLLLRLRDAFLRYRQNSRLSGGDAETAADAWQRPLVGFKGAVAKLLAQHDSGELMAPDAVGRDRFLTAAIQSRLLWEAARGAADGGRRLAEAWPEGRQLVLADGLSQLRAAAVAIDAADAVLATETPQAGDWQRRRDEAAAACDAFAARAVGIAELEPVVREVRAKLAAVDRVTSWDDAAVRARRLALGEVRAAVAVLERRAAAVAERADSDPGGFEGGPEDIWADESRRQALGARRLVVDEWLAARRAAMVGVLATPPEAAAAPWAAFAMRLGISELGGAARGGRRQQQRETKGDPLVGWLRREIDAARKALRSSPSQGVYQKATLEYLDSVGDLLRY